MTRILLTGAGFSNNWGGLVASEFFSRLLSAGLDARTRDLLFKSRAPGAGGFETVMTQLQGVHSNSPEDEKRLDDFTAAVVGIFNSMNNQFLYGNLEFQNEVRYMVRAFLERFDAIFTLNQDCLLEAQYFPGFVGGRLAGHPRVGPAASRARNARRKNCGPDSRYGPLSDTAADPAIFQASWLIQLDHRWQ